ncbi:MAG: DNA mismatch repair endonuclease MutL [Patescibacteria group bacterium]|nr:DNA mismatch repair endonuclease MutL [Patescibacteria group bacterium]
MPVINVLPENLINQIAAGEVVERPASCVKELLENSIDAEARNIHIEIENGGKTYIKVVDDGFGMDKKDAKMCFSRHATSKITSQEDLARIDSMGFRGEALASIASVSHLKLQTKKRGEMVGTLVVMEGGRLTKYEECAAREGTQIEIKNLFANTPARLKYLKAETTEFQNVLSFVTGIALSHPWLAIKLLHNGKPILDLPGGQSPLDRVRYVLGRETADNVIPIFHAGVSMKIEGYLGKPALARSNSDHQYISVNNRPVQNAAVAFAVKDSFKTLLPHGKYPLFVINIGLDPTQVDVNVHPRKLEIKFLNQQEVFSKVRGTVSASLDKFMLAPKITGMPTGVPQQSQTQETMGFSAQFAAIPQERDHQSIQMTPVAQIANSYIIAQDEEGLLLIDQHAAHERVMYERLMREYKEKSTISSQPLLLPVNIDLDPKDAEILNGNLKHLEELGFAIEPFSGNTFAVNAVPSPLSTNEDAGEVLRGLVDDIKDSTALSNVQGRKEELLNYIACRSAIKFGQRLSYEEQVRLIYDLEHTEKRFTCPHGRPTMIQLTFDELEKRFHRK